MFGIFALGALLLFAAINFFALAIFGLGFVLLMALWLRRRSGFWWLAAGATLLSGGAGALGGSWGAGYATFLWWPESGWPLAAWIAGYVAGGIGGALLGAFGVALRRRAELPDLESGLKGRFRDTKNQWRRHGLRQSVRWGAYSFRCALFKRAKS